MESATCIMPSLQRDTIPLLLLQRYHKESVSQDGSSRTIGHCMIIKKISASSIFNPSYAASNAINGFYVSKHFSTYHSHSKNPNPWLLIELNEVKPIQTVLVMRRDFNPDFQYIVVEVGFSENSLKELDFYEYDTTPSREPVEFTAKHAIKGKFIRISKQNDHVSFAVAEIAILGP